MLKGIRGAATARSNSPDDIRIATQDMLREIMKANDLTVDRVISAIFTLTPDLDAAFPATAARAIGWTGVPMVCAQEIPVPGALPLVVRVLIHADLAGAAQHVYQGGATILRPDWVTTSKEQVK
jgi:chorismate mutase